MTCPKCDYERTPQDRAPSGECPRCGVVYEKWRARLDALPAGPSATSAPAALAASAPWPVRGPAFDAGVDAAPEASLVRRAFAALVEVKPSVGPFEFWGHAALYLGLFLWGWRFVLADYSTGK